MNCDKYEQDWRNYNRDKWEAHFVSRGITCKIPRFSGTIASRAIDGGYFFADHGLNDFSGIELAGLINMDNCDKENSSQFLSVLYGAISNLFRDYSEEMIDLQMPAIHLLRIRTGNHKGNLHLTKGYKVDKNSTLVKKVSDPIYDLQISSEDWRQGLSLPLPPEIDYNIAKLFGFYWALGSLHKVSKSAFTLNLSVNESMKDLLTNEVKPLMQRVHNIHVWDREQNSDVTYESRSCILQGYSINKTSMALAYFLMNEHNFPSNNVSRRERKSKRIPKDHLPNLSFNQNVLEGFMSGLIRSRGFDGSYTSHSRRSNPETCERISIGGNGNYYKELIDLLRASGYGCSIGYNHNSWRIYLNKQPTIHFREVMSRPNLAL